MYACACRLWEREGKKTKEQGREAPEGGPQESGAEGRDPKGSVALILWLASLPRGHFIHSRANPKGRVRVLMFIVPIDLQTFSDFCFFFLVFLGVFTFFPGVCVFGVLVSSQPAICASLGPDTSSSLCIPVPVGGGSVLQVGYRLSPTVWRQSL